MADDVAAAQQIFRAPRYRTATESFNRKIGGVDL
jgi:hypothetical protein